MFNALKSLFSRSPAVQKQEEPDTADSLHQRGLELFQQGALDKASDAFREALKKDPAHRLARRDLCLALVQKGMPAQAKKLIKQGLAEDPLFVDYHYYLGNIVAMEERFEEAIAAYRQALRLKPDYPEVLLNLGTLLRKRRRFQEAEDALKEAIRISPGYALACLNLGVTYFEQGQFTEAADWYRQAMEKGVKDGAPYCNLGILAFMENRMDEAVALYDKALEISPDFPLAHYTKATVQLLRGQLAEGFRGYEYRWAGGIDGAVPPRPFVQPLWLGDTDLNGKTLLLHAEQGLGDSLQMVRYVPQLLKHGAKVWLEVQKPLVGFLSQLEGISGIIATGDPLPEFDMHCPLLSLPLALRTELNTIPAPVRYLTAPPEPVAHWKHRLENLGSPRIGLVWSGSTIHINDHNRSLPLDQLLPYLGDRRFVSLQKEVRERDRAVLQQADNILDISQYLTDFSETAAVIENLDLVISVDTSVAHLAAALGKPVWILLPYIPDWRWLMDRSDSPWYPSVRLFRQTGRGAWQTALAELRNALAAQ